MFGTLVSDMQTGVSVTDSAITGTLKFLSTGALVDQCGAGYFVGLKFGDIPEDATSVMVGMDPSQSSGLVEIINDPDLNGAFKVTDKATQKFKTVTTTPDGETVKEYTLSDLTLEPDTTVYTSEQLNAMTLNQIKAIATARGYTITATLKAEVIEQFLEQQN